jgi:predicted deacylase
MNRKSTVLLLAVLSALAYPLRAAEEFRLGPIIAAPGESRSGSLDVTGPGGEKTFIPVTVINGIRPGRTAAFVAGTHGAEYPPILALQRIRETLDPKKLTGTVMFVHVSNLPSFRARTIYYSPIDGLNLNRVYPGDPSGTISRRIAFVMTEQVVKRCDVLVDMHCGDANEDLMSYTYWMISGRSALDEESKSLALAFGLSPIIIDTTREKDPAHSKYLGNTAMLMGKAAITTEAGRLGRTDEESVEANVRGVWSVLRRLGMVPGDAAPVRNPVWIDKYEVVNSEKDGLFAAGVRSGDRVQAGQVVGILRDYWGTVLSEIRAPFAGLILYIIGTPPANAGEPLFEVGRVKQ